MTIPDTPELPAWVDNGAKSIRGLDLLGLRAPAQALSNHLIDGATTVTPAVRYLAMRAWIVRTYWEQRRPDRLKDFNDWAGRVEAAFVLANRVRRWGTASLVGAEEAGRLLSGEADPVTVKTLVKSPAATIYGVPSDQLGLSAPKPETGVPRLSEERGLPLSAAFSARLGRVDVGAQISSEGPPENLSRADLEQLASVVWLEDIPEDERAALVDAIVPEAPRNAQEVRRVATYGLLLAIADRMRRAPTMWDVLDHVAGGDTPVPQAELQVIVDGWTLYAVRDVLAAGHEAVLQQAVRSLANLGGEDRSFVTPEASVEWLLGRHEEVTGLLEELGILESGVDWTRLKWSDLVGAVDSDLGPPDARRGLARWGSALTEPRLAHLALTSGAGALPALAVSWLVVDRRSAPGIEARRPEFAWLSRAGWSRIGVSQVVRPMLASLDVDDPPLPEALARLTVRTVDQHTRVAWTRLAEDPRRDVTVIVSDGDRWALRRNYAAGRTNSRLGVALGWLNQLGLVAPSGVSATGAAVLERACNVLRATPVQL
ncbi:MAG: hypothetical protein ACOZNI_27120 [Myxococcota bacterium]